MTTIISLIFFFLLPIAFSFGYIRGYEDIRSIRNWGIGFDEGWDDGWGRGFDAGYMCGIEERRKDKEGLKKKDEEGMQ